MSSRSKGNRNVRKVKRYFEERGYLVSKVEKSGSRYLKERDLFALSLGDDYSDKGFDLIALGDGNIIFIQVKSNNRSTSYFYIDFAKKYADGYIEILDAVCIDYKGVRLIWYEPDGSTTEGFIPIKDVPSP